jgi:GNAT superfamily N-acetyltransferase
MDLTSSKIAALARYWEAKRAGRAMPLWRDIDPAEIKPLLPHLLVTRYAYNPFRPRFVLVGTWLAQYAGGDFTGRYLDEVDFSSELDTDWPAFHRRFVAEARPVFGICKFLTESGLERDYESAMFPIAAEDGKTVERALGLEDFPVGTDVVPDARIVAPRPKILPAGGAASAPETGMPRLEPVGAGDLGLRRCLTEAQLPTADLVGPGKHYFRLMEGQEPRGYGGFEALGEHALLRSIVVEGENRGRGYGRNLVRALMAEAKRSGAKDAYLLTETAATFFTAMDFLPCPRDSAPAEIRATRQFNELCAATAKLLRRMLD